jgi:hypothetical protein
MRVVVLTALITLLPLPAAAEDGFRARLNDYVADQGGCPRSRALVERELVAFERGRAEGEPGSLALFGKLAAEWTAEDIQDLIAVIRACEALRPRPRPAEDGERRLAERLDYLAQAMRRAIVLSTQPSAIPEGSAPSGLRADAPPEAGGGPGAAPRSGRRGQGPAFVPVDASRPAPASVSAPDEGRRPFSPERSPAEASLARAAPALGPAEAAAPRREALRVAFAPGSAAPGIGSAFHRAAAVPEAPVVACVVTRERFERIRAGMSPNEVEGVFGCRGRLDSAAAIEGIGTFEVHVWSPPSLAGSVTVTFQDRRLKAKVQRGLI